MTLCGIVYFYEADILHVGAPISVGCIASSIHRSAGEGGTHLMIAAADHGFWIVRPKTRIITSLGLLETREFLIDARDRVLERSKAGGIEIRSLPHARPGKFAAYATYAAYGGGLMKLAIDTAIAHGSLAGERKCPHGAH